MRKYIFIFISLIILTYVCLHFINKSDEEVHDSYYIQSVLFKDDLNNLIPISIDMNNSESKLQTIYNKIEIMKSDSLIDKGLLPVFDDSLEVLDLDIKEKHIDMHLYTSHSDHITLRTLEALIYILKDVYDGYETNIIFYSENQTDSPTVLKYNNISHKLGINNFEDASLYLHESVPVEVYKDTTISNNNYIYPSTYRINQIESMFNNVQYILNQIDQQILLKDVYVDEYGLKVELDNNILNDNEKINLEMENKIVLSLMSLGEFEHISILVNGENVRNHNETNIMINYFQVI